MSEVARLIDCLRKSREKIALNSISDFNLLVNSLEELDKMIEMKSAKKTVVAQIKFLLVNNIFDREANENFEKHMLHTVIAGPPGVGKTHLGIILSKIWNSLGLLKNSPNLIQKKDQSDQEDSLNNINELERQIHNLNSANKIKNNVVKNLQEKIGEIKKEIQDIDKGINSVLFDVKTLKRELYKNNEYSDKVVLGVNKFGLIENILTDLSKSEMKLQNIYNTSIPEETVTLNIKKKKNVDTEFKEINDIINDINNKVDNFGFGKKQDSQKEEEKKEEDEISPKFFDGIRIVSREDFVGAFLGQTALKTEKLLRESLGKVLFIDEAYSLVNDDKDSFGKEALTVLNRFMSEYSDRIIIIFAGYKELLDQTIFYYQPGLKRRISWNFEIEKYSEKGLSEIFMNQLGNNKWKLAEDVNLEIFFNENKEEFPHFGGDTLRLAFYCKICYATEVFDNVYPNTKVINQKILNDAFQYLKDYRKHEQPIKMIESVKHMFM
jgi:DNA polymerase III delta prime subunit